MTHIPTIESVNAWCPTCQTRFGLVQANNQVTCPDCKTIQTLPIVQVSRDEFVCMNCSVRFGAPTEAAKCHVCQASPSVTLPGTT